MRGTPHLFLLEKNSSNHRIITAQPPVFMSFGVLYPLIKWRDLMKSSLLFKRCLSLLIAVFMLIPVSIIAGAFPASGPTHNGIDVSYYQKNIDFQSVRQAGIEVVYIRASEGTGYIDPYFRQNYNNASANGLNTGFYHYLTARDTQEAIREAQHFVSVISGTSPDCRLCMDIEDISGLSITTVNDIAFAFLQEVERLSGKEVVIYASASTARNILSPDLAEQYPIWVANYGVSEPEDNGKWDSWVGFQYTSTGSIAGINGNVDLDLFTDGIFLSNNDPVPPSTKPTPITSTRSIIVKRGDTLSGIAAQYGTTVTQLVRLNNISNPNLIYIGEVIKISQTTASPGNENPTNPDTIANSYIHYTVRRGDTLSSIAARYDSTVSAISGTNDLSNPNLIYVGERLLIPTVRQYNGTTYTVRSGDTLSEIAARYHISVASLVNENNIANPNLIYPGQILKINY